MTKNCYSLRTKYNVKIKEIHKIKIRTNTIYKTETTILIHFCVKKNTHSVYLSLDRTAGGTSSSFLSNSFSLKVCSSTSPCFSFSSCVSLCKGREDKIERKPVILEIACRSFILLQSETKTFTCRIDTVQNNI